jgi:hypothetical protein
LPPISPLPFDPPASPGPESGIPRRRMQASLLESNAAASAEFCTAAWNAKLFGLGGRGVVAPARLTIANRRAVSLLYTFRFCAGDTRLMAAKLRGRHAIRIGRYEELRRPRYVEKDRQRAHSQLRAPGTVSPLSADAGGSGGHGLVPLPRCADRVARLRGQSIDDYRSSLSRSRSRSPASMPFPAGLPEAGEHVLVFADVSLDPRPWKRRAIRDVSRVPDGLVCSPTQLGRRKGD